MAVSKLKCAIFNDPRSLVNFATTDANVLTIVSITTDLNNKYVLFYLTP